MKCVLLSVKPQWVVKILNGEKTIEVRKRFPIDYVGWVYVYCTKDKTTTINLETLLFGNPKNATRNGMVVARFWCDKVDTFRCIITGNLKDGFFKAKPYCKVIEDGIANYNCDDEFENILKNAQLTNKELAQYLGDKEYPYGGWYVFNAIHITNLEIFDRPKEISEFKRCQLLWNCEPHDCKTCRHLLPLTRAPQSYMFIEV